MPRILGAGHNINKNFVKKVNCGCPRSVNNKYLVSSGNVAVPDRTQVQRTVAAIRSPLAGIIRFGNQPILSRTYINKNPKNPDPSECVVKSLATFLGRTEGQPGGILGPLKNRF